MGDTMYSTCFVLNALQSFAWNFVSATELNQVSIKVTAAEDKFLSLFPW